jgi:hypothetical protein
MPSANKDRIRITLHVDREIYRLVKIWSKIDNIPISRLFDQVFAPQVKRFTYPSPEDWEIAKAERGQDIPDDLLTLYEEDQKFMKQIENLSEEEKMKILYESALKKKKEQDAYREKWIKAINEEP